VAVPLLEGPIVLQVVFPSKDPDEPLITWNVADWYLFHAVHHRQTHLYLGFL